MKTANAKLLSKDYIFAMSAVMGTSFVNYFFFATLSLFAENLTGTVRYAGYLSLVYSATALVTRPVTGILADRHGRVRYMAAGSAICAVACLLYSFTTGLILLLFIRVLNGIGMSMNTTAAGAAIPDIVPKEKLAEGIGVFGLGTAVAQAVGPFISLAIVGDGDMLARFNTLFYVAAGFCAVSFIFGCFIKYERTAKLNATGAQTGSSNAPVVQTMAEFESDKSGEKLFFGIESRLFPLILIHTLYFFGISGIMSFLTSYAKYRMFNLDYLGWYFFASAVGLLIFRLLFGKLVDKRGSDIVVIPGLILMAAYLFVLPFISSLPLLIISALPYGIAGGAVGPAINAAMFRRSSPKRRGAISAAYYVTIDVGITLGTPIMGLVADYIDFSWVFWLSAITIAIAFLLYVRFGSDKRYEKNADRTRN